MVNNAEVLLHALDYIEDNIAGEITLQELADDCYVSVSSLQKTFKYVFHVSVKEYILRRRFSCAAKYMLHSDDSILDIALRFGYSNAESFTRGFRKIWGITPSEYRKTWHFSDHTPKFSVQRMYFDLEDDDMGSIKYDLTQLYDVIQERRNNAYVCADLSRLMWINDNLGRDAGDAALLELMRRVENACNDEDIFLRIGGDEFVVFTNSHEMEHANEIVQEVTRKNNQTIKCGDKEFPVQVHIGAFQGNFEKHVNVKDMFVTIAEGIHEIHMR